MHFPTILAGIATFTSAVAATPKETPHVGVAIMTVNRPVKGEKSTLPLSVPLGVLTHEKNIKITELEISHVYSNVRGIEAPKLDSITCQMYKDKYGTQPASKEFTAKKDGIVSKDTVYLGWVLCRVNAKA